MQENEREIVKNGCEDLFLIEGSVLFEGDVGVEFGGAFVAFGDEVEADTADVLLGTEVLEVVDLLAFDLEFQQAEVLQI